MISNAERLARAVLLFHRGGQWTDSDREAWKSLTGTDEATTVTLCNLARHVRDEEEGGVMGDNSGTELALGRPLFPVVALRAMSSIAEEDSSWAVPHEDEQYQEPMLVMLWRGATEEDEGRDRYLGDREKRDRPAG